MEDLSNFDSISIDKLTIEELTIGEVKIHKLKIGKLTIDDFSIDELNIDEQLSNFPGVFQENPSPDIPQQNPPAFPEENQPAATKEASPGSSNPILRFLDKPRFRVHEASLERGIIMPNFSRYERNGIPLPGPIDNDNDCDYSFDIKPASRLKLALEVLSDLDFNPDGVGRIDIDNEKGLGITVLNPDDNISDKIFGRFWLRIEEVQNFHCSKPMVRKVEIRKILRNLSNLDADDQDTVTVSHTPNSYELSFKFGDEPRRGFTVPYLIYPDIPEFPEVTNFCQAAVTMTDLEQMIKHLSKDGQPQIVTFEMSKTIAEITVGKEKIVTYDYEKLGIDGTNGLVGTNQRHIGYFYWTHPAMLQKAARLDPALIVSFVSEPQYVMLLFTLKELGELMLLKEAFSLIPNIQDKQPFYETRPE